MVDLRLFNAADGNWVAVWVGVLVGFLFRIAFRTGSHCVLGINYFLFPGGWFIEELTNPTTKSMLLYPAIRLIRRSMVFYI